MILFRLYFYPASLFNKYPVRVWRRVTLWLKWGLLIPYLAIILRLVIDSPEEVSSIFSFISFVAEESELAIPFAVQFGLFMVVQGAVLIFVWLLRGLLIYLYYRVSRVKFDEREMALSIAAAGLLTGIWNLLPFGFLIPYVLTLLHSLFLTTYLIFRVNRTTLPQAFLGSLLPALIPLLF